MSELDLPPFSLDVETLNLGPDVKAIGMELIETESREPVQSIAASLSQAKRRERPRCCC